jgi:hypothetical protein
MHNWMQGQRTWCAEKNDSAGDIMLHERSLDRKGNPNTSDCYEIVPTRMSNALNNGHQ